MEFVSYLIDLFLHLDKYLATVIENYGVLTYALLFLIVFMETGFVVTPFLPGDSLLFAAGTFASPALGEALNIWILIPLLSLAAILGDTVNYWIGHFIGPKAFSGDIRFLKKEYLDRTHEFYERHGGKTIILARFVPIIRTFAPFVAGIGAMNYRRFIIYNVVGGILWVSIFTLAGYFFGSIPFVKDNFTIVVLVIIAISVMPVVFEFVKERWRIMQEQKAETP
ncbi:MAG: DedA family protein [Chloroflexota bacterium]|nr:DedA family protein [Chloroflexota bacterium]